MLTFLIPPIYRQDHAIETEGNKTLILTFFIMASIIALHRAKTHISNDDVIVLLFYQQSLVTLIAL